MQKLFSESEDLAEQFEKVSKLLEDASIVDDFRKADRDGFKAMANFVRNLEEQVAKKSRPYIDEEVTKSLQGISCDNMEADFAAAKRSAAKQKTYGSLSDRLESIEGGIDQTITGKSDKLSNLKNGVVYVKSDAASDKPLPDLEGFVYTRISEHSTHQLFYSTYANNKLIQQTVFERFIQNDLVAKWKILSGKYPLFIGPLAIQSDNTELEMTSDPSLSNSLLFYYKITGNLRGWNAQYYTTGILPYYYIAKYDDQSFLFSYAKNTGFEGWVTDKTNPKKLLLRKHNFADISYECELVVVWGI